MDVRKTRTPTRRRPPPTTGEKFEGEAGDGFFGGLPACAVDWVPVAPLLLYHTLEYLPSFQDFSDSLVNIVGGAKLKLTTTRFFADFRVEFAYDSTPPPAREVGHPLHSRGRPGLLRHHMAVESYRRS